MEDSNRENDQKVLVLILFVHMSGLVDGSGTGAEEEERLSRHT